ncbi:MAG: TetR/AcrR family transcriptional regulator [Elusimicrobia bacterium]|nr:TetR/AcrR family transcriptional regulator [Elusimicrobiota bacterium]
MPRPSRNTDKLLIAAGRELLARKGVSGLSLREVAKRARVNLGMFHYHFKTKGEFARRVLQEMYEELFSRLSFETAEGGPLERLERTLNILGRFARDNRALALCIAQDAAAGNKPTLEFLLKNFPRHAVILIGLLRECQKAGLVRRAPIARVLTFIGGGVMAPALMVAALERALGGGLAGLPVKAIAAAALSDDAVAERVRMALQGAKP